MQLVHVNVRASLDFFCHVNCFYLSSVLIFPSLHPTLTDLNQLFILCLLCITSVIMCPYNILLLFSPGARSSRPLICHLIFLFSAGCCWTFSTSATLCSSLPSLFGLLVAPSCLSLWTSHRILYSVSCHQGYRKGAERSPVWCAISSNSLHLDCFLYTFSAQQKHYSGSSFLPSFLPFDLHHPSLSASISLCSLLLHDMFFYLVCFLRYRRV